MSGGNDITDAALWRRWRDGKSAAGEAAAEPDASILAAYAENRLSRPGTDPEADPVVAAVEAWLADNSEALEDVLAARAVGDSVADAAITARAQALIASPQGNVVPLRRTGTGWRSTIAWSGIAASLVAAVLIGFSLGNNDIVDLSDGGQNPAVEQVLIDSPGSILAADDEDTGI
jgi:hypothetical protein